MKLPAAAALLSVFLTMSAQADVPIDRYQHLKEHSDRFASYIHALGKGILIANANLLEQGQQPLFCVPEHFLGDKYDMMRIIESGIARQSDSETQERLTVEDIAIDAFQAAYPCEHKLSSR